MAKAQRRDALDEPRDLDRIVQEAAQLRLRLETIQSTAICVQLALTEQNVDYDEDIARCVQRNIADEIGRVSEKLAALIAALRALRPVIPAKRSGRSVKPRRARSTRAGKPQASAT
jgi:hypothetical protein